MKIIKITTNDVEAKVETMKYQTEGIANSSGEALQKVSASLPNRILIDNRLQRNYALKNF